MKNRTLNQIPSILDAIYQGHSIPEIIDIRSKMLRDTEDVGNIAHATTLQNYKATAINERHLSKIRSLFNKTFNLLYDSVDYSCTLEARRKCLTSTDNKILRLRHDNQSLDLLRDFLGFRIILYGNKAIENLTLDCYRLMQNLINFYSKEGYILCDAAPQKNTDGFHQENFPDIYVPDKKAIEKVFYSYYGVKDYIQFPKKNGYQSLHAVFRDKDGKFFEVQIRLFSHHIAAEACSANHDNYKYELYADFNEKLDYSKIDIPGFAIAPNGEIFDYVGLTKSLLIFHRQKTY